MSDPTVLVIGENEFDFHRLDEKRELFETIFEDAGIEAEITTDRTMLTADRLEEYDVLVDYLTNPPTEHAADVIEFVRSGGGYMGVHCAADVSSFMDEPADDIAALIGGRFVQHPEQSTFGVEILDQEHPVTEGIGDFEVYDEPYEMAMEPDVERTVLATMDHPELAGTPVVWTRTEGSGRVCYCSLGHTRDAFEHPNFQRLLIQGIAWVIR